MRRLASAVVVAVCAQTALPVALRAQAAAGATPQCAVVAGAARDTSAAGAARAKPMVLLQAEVHMRELRFESQPQASVSFRGCPGLDTLIVTRRENLPKPVVPGVTYRDVTIAVELRSWLGLQCLRGGAAGRAADSAAAGAPGSLAAAICQSVGARDSTGTPRR